MVAESSAICCCREEAVFSALRLMERLYLFFGIGEWGDGACAILVHPKILQLHESFRKWGVYPYQEISREEECPECICLRAV